LANAQLLIYVLRPTEVSSEAFQAAAVTASRSRGLTPGAWTYSAVPVNLVASGDSRLVARVSGGPLDGQEFSFPSAFTPGRFMLSAYRQNVAGVPDEGDTSGVFSGFLTVFREAAGLGATSSTTSRAGFRTLRNAMSWDRGVPRVLELGGGASGSGLGWGVLALIGVGGIYVASRGSTGFSGAPERRQAARAVDRAKQVLRSESGTKRREAALRALRQQGYSDRQIQRIAGAGR
jgi:hypothetical protein